jgi:class 3 adenylate cyclase
MEPQVRYVTSSDGTNIATWRVGKGPPLVLVGSIWATPAELYWTNSSEHLELLADKRTVVFYDNRGQGLSDRDVDDFSLDARLRDLSAVIESINAPSVDLMAATNSGPVAITYAAKNPEAVRRLILSNTSARNRDVRLDPERRAILGLAQVNWVLFNRVSALITYGFTPMAEEIAEKYAESMTPEVLAVATRAAWEWDATEAAAGVKCPTLVLYQRTNPTLSMDSAKKLASRIADSRLVVYELPGIGQVTLVGSRETIATIDAFLDEDEFVSEQAPEATLPSGMTAILFTDIADSTRLTEKMGDARFREAASKLDKRTRAVIREAGGTPVDGKVLGDGVMAVFSAASQAIEAAIRCRDEGNGAGLPLHIGVHAGDVIRDGNTVYGGAVNVASRVCGLSAAGEVLVSETVRSLARTSAGVAFEDRGAQALKGVREAVRVWAVVAEEQGTRNREQG